MLLVPVLLVVDARDPAEACRIAERELRDRAVHIDSARRLSPLAAATAGLRLAVDANNLELPARRSRRLTPPGPRAPAPERSHRNVD
jgi:hypothetical protein